MVKETQDYLVVNNLMASNSKLAEEWHPTKNGNLTPKDVTPSPDRKGLSYYSYDKICSLLQITVDEYILARDLLIKKDLIAFDGYFFQVLSLPEEPRSSSTGPLKTHKDMQTHDPATIRQLIQKSFGAKPA